MLTVTVHVLSDAAFCAGPGLMHDTSVRILHKPQQFMSENGHELDNFPDRMKNASMLNDNTNWEPKDAKQLSSSSE